MEATWTTPGTRLRWSTLEEWLLLWRQLHGEAGGARWRHRAARKVYADRTAHLDALSLEAVETGSDDDVAELRRVALAEQPARGFREGHVTTRLLDWTHEVLARRERTRAQLAGVALRLGWQREPVLVPVGRRVA